MATMSRVHRQRRFEQINEHRVARIGAAGLRTPTRDHKPALIAAACAAAMCSVGCIGTPGTAVTNATTIVYTRGAKQDMIAVKLQVSKTKAFATVYRLVTEDPDAVLDSQNEAAGFLEASKDGVEWAAQATELGNDQTLLYLWLDTTDTSLVAHDLGLSAVKMICDELNVVCNVVEY
jgi:hypothetical protein